MARNDAEFRLHCAVVDHLRLAGKRGVFWFHPANGEARSPRTGARLKRMGVRPGVPDLVLLINGRSHGLELKAAGGRQNENQRLVEAAWEAAGGVYEIARGIDEALEVLRLWGALPADYEFIPARRRQLTLEAV